MDEILHLNGKPKGLVFAVSAPSGTGKTTLCSMLSVEFGNIKPSVSYTTRTKRKGEKDGVSYYFINDAEFDKMIKEGEFIEWANIFGKRYGTAYKSVVADNNSLFDILLEIDVQGVERLIKIYRGIKNANRLVTVFITPPSYSDLQTRLLKRGGMSEEELSRRINIAGVEVKKSGIYDYIITNDDLDEAYLKLKSIVIAERCRNKFKLD
ncbi:guanylate kinase [Candidatus Acidulodesulfobacterium sp. H_13]|uniref:guanylate kinase n=1 Tax=Candidatus Acidulodesulfobacterium sp. H_13 TaxID=3395470 RepID=UPI003AF8A89F